MLPVAERSNSPGALGVYRETFIVLGFKYSVNAEKTAFVSQSRTRTCDRVGVFAPKKRHSQSLKNNAKLKKPSTPHFCDTVENSIAMKYESKTSSLG